MAVSAQQQLDNFMFVPTLGQPQPGEPGSLAAPEPGPSEPEQPTHGTILHQYCHPTFEACRLDETCATMFVGLQTAGVEGYKQCDTHPKCRAVVDCVFDVLGSQVPETCPLTACRDDEDCVHLIAAPELREVFGVGELDAWNQFDIKQCLGQTSCGPLMKCAVADVTNAFDKENVCEAEHKACNQSDDCVSAIWDMTRTGDAMTCFKDKECKDFVHCSDLDLEYMTCRKEFATCKVDAECTKLMDTMPDQETEEAAFLEWWTESCAKNAACENAMNCINTLVSEMGPCPEETLDCINSSECSKIVDGLLDVSPGPDHTVFQDIDGKACAGQAECNKLQQCFIKDLHETSTVEKLSEDCVKLMDTCFESADCTGALHDWHWHRATTCSEDPKCLPVMSCMDGVSLAMNAGNGKCTTEKQGCKNDPTCLSLVTTWFEKGNKDKDEQCRANEQCKALLKCEGGSYHVVLRQTLPFAFEKDQFTLNPTDSTAENFAILDQLDQYKDPATGNFKFLLRWPEHEEAKKAFKWMQKSNPTKGEVSGYQAFEAAAAAHESFKGLKPSDMALLSSDDGTHVVGAYQGIVDANTGIPTYEQDGAMGHTDTVELHAFKPYEEEGFENDINTFGQNAKESIVNFGEKALKKVNELSPATIAGIIVASVLGCCALTILTYCCCCKSSKYEGVSTTEESHVINQPDSNRHEPAKGDLQVAKDPEDPQSKWIEMRDLTPPKQQTGPRV